MYLKIQEKMEYFKYFLIVFFGFFFLFGQLELLRMDRMRKKWCDEG